MYQYCKQSIKCHIDVHINLLQPVSMLIVVKTNVSSHSVNRRWYGICFPKPFPFNYCLAFNNKNAQPHKRPPQPAGGSTSLIKQYFSTCHHLNQKQLSKWVRHNMGLQFRSKKKTFIQSTTTILQWMPFSMGEKPYSNPGSNWSQRQIWSGRFQKEIPSKDNVLLASQIFDVYQFKDV